MGYLIAETTKEEREKIVAESLGYIEASCDGCMAGLAEIYQDYIDGKNSVRSIWSSMQDTSRAKKRCREDIAAASVSDRTFDLNDRRRL